MAATSAPSVKKALLELFEKELKGVQVAYAHPGATIQQEAVYFNRTMEREAAAALGNLRRDEDYEMELIVDVALDGDNAQGAEERCWAIVSVVENLVRVNPGKAGDVLAGLISGWCVFLSAEMTPHIEPGQRLAEAVCRIAVKNRK